MPAIKTSLKVASLAAVTIIAALILSLTVSVSPAHAVPDASLNSLKTGTLQLSYVPGKSMLNKVSFWGNPGQKVTNLKSSKKSVVAATLKYERNLKNPIVTLKLKKAGTSKVTFKVKGKKYAVKVKVVKYQQAIESLTIGTKDCTGDLSTKMLARAVGGDYLALPMATSNSNKVNVVAADGWTFKKINTYTYVKGKTKVKTYKNGATVKGSFTILMQNNKTGLKEYYAFQTF